MRKEQESIAINNVQMINFSMENYLFINKLYAYLHAAYL